MRRVRKMNGSMSITNRGAATLSPKSHSVHEHGSEGDHQKQGLKNLAYIKSIVRALTMEERELMNVTFVMKLSLGMTTDI